MTETAEQQGCERHPGEPSMYCSTCRQGFGWLHVAYQRSRATVQLRKQREQEARDARAVRDGRQP
jgi:hypothetical protein